MRYFIHLSYNGGAYCGWQRQPDMPSVQQTLEEALATVLREPVSVVGAGRTDTGVHAARYVAHFDFPGEVGEANDDPDRILSTDRHGDVKVGRDGEPKVAIDGIEKGILADGMDFKNSNNMWETGGSGQPTIEGFQKFAVAFADMLGLEVAGAYFVHKGSSLSNPNYSHIYMEKYSGNTATTANFHSGYPYQMNPGLRGTAHPHTMWHTHPAASSYTTLEDRIKPSEKDLRAPEQLPNYTRFIILTQGQPPISF